MMYCRTSSAIGSECFFPFLDYDKPQEPEHPLFGALALY